MPLKMLQHQIFQQQLCPSLIWIYVDLDLPLEKQALIGYFVVVFVIVIIAGGINAVPKVQRGLRGLVGEK